MKRLYIILIFFAFTDFLLGNPVSKEKAIIVASNFVYGDVVDVVDVTMYGDKVEGGIYVINFKPEGWALVSSDDDAQPVLGYSLTGYFNTDGVKYNVKDWLDIQKNQIQRIEAENARWKNEWETLEKGAVPMLKSSALSIDPMLETEWDQGAGWNTLCPPDEDGPGGKAYIGCVAVAMAQALHHIKFPERPQGVKSYALSPYGTITCNFDAESPYQWDQMSITRPDEYNAELLYHCAVAVEMDFGGDGSGAYTTRVPFAFQRYFGFTPAVLTIDRFENEDDWITLLKEELNEGNVLIYSGNPGTGQAGHAFNIDGYAPSGYFHFNWGWSGSYNGYFSINDITPGNNNFGVNQKAVIGISVPYWGPRDILLSNTTVSEDKPAGATVGEIEVVDYSESDTFTFEVLGAPYFQDDGYAPAKFYVEDMMLKTLEPLTAGPYPEVATIRVTDSEGYEFEKQFDIAVTKPTFIPGKTTGGFAVYPNPVYNKLNITNAEHITSAVIFDLNGKLIREIDLSNANVDVSNIHAGIYVLKIKDSNGSDFSWKFIKQ